MGNVKNKLCLLTQFCSFH